MEGHRKCAGVILAGGAGTRLGGAHKGLLQIGGRRIVDRIADALRGSTDQIVVAAGSILAPDVLPGVRCVHDIVPGAGPLAGIHAAMLALECDVIVCGWDMPGVNAGLLRELRRLGELGRDAVVPCSEPEGRSEPLCAWYSISVLPSIESHLASGSAKGILETLAGRDVHLVQPESVRQFGDPATLFMNVNTPDDLDKARTSFKHNV